MPSSSTASPTKFNEIWHTPNTNYMMHKSLPVIHLAVTLTMLLLGSFLKIFLGSLMTIFIWEGFINIPGIYLAMNYRFIDITISKLNIIKDND